VPRLLLALEKAFESESGGPPSHENSNNPLAVEPETENDAGRSDCSRRLLFQNSLRLKRRLKRQQQGFIQMFSTLRRDAAFCALAATVLFAAATPALSQGPSDAQREAVKSQCRSDYMAHCSSVPPGGEASLQCLAKNMSSLSAGCATAVRAVEAAAAPKSEPAPAAAAPAKESAPAAATAKPATAAASPAAAAPAKQPTSAQVSAVKSACRSDYPKVCAGVPTGGAPALQCLEKNKAKLSAGCEKAVTAATGGAAPAAGSAPAAAAAPAAGAAPAAAPTVIVLRPMLPREELFVMRSACGGDVRTLCAGVAPGGGRIMQCLANRGADLSPACRDVLAPFAAR
jgi:hypothetical protein